MDDEDTIRAAELLRGSNGTVCSGMEEGRASAVDPSGYYARLGLSPKATQQEIRRAFLFLSQRYHTDKHASQGEELQRLMNDRFQELQDAYTVLSDERQRAAYDASGDTGVQRLALVPVGVHRRHDVLRYILSLDREAQLLRTAQLLSATSAITVNFSTAHLFTLPRPDRGNDSRSNVEKSAGAESSAPRDTEISEKEKSASDQLQLARLSSHEQPKATQRVDAAATSSPTEGAAASSSIQARPGAPLQGATSSADSTGPSEDENESSASTVSALQTHLTAREAVIDGQRHIVLLPSPELEEQLRQRLSGVTNEGVDSLSSPGGKGGINGAKARAGQRQRGLSVSRAMLLAAVPKYLKFRGSFRHLITPQLSITFRNDASSGMRKATTSFTTLAEYTPDEVRSYTTSLRMAVHGLKWCVAQARALNPLWTLRSKVTLLSNSALLQKLELTLTRKLSATAELENMLAMSLTEHGYFRTSLSNLTEDVQQGISTFIAFHNVNLTAFASKKVVIGVDTNDPKHPPKYGRVQYSVNCSPFAGQSTFSVEAWYMQSSTQHYGLAFTAVVPYAPSPIAPPIFFVRSAQFAVVNQVSLLYARGQHRISVPIIVFISPKVSHGLMWLSAPLALYRIGSLLYRPYARAKAIRYYTQQRELHVAEMDVAREKARMEQRALESLVLMNRAREERRGGLVIINARYGVIEPQFAEVSPAVTAATRSVSGWFPSKIISSVARRLFRRQVHDSRITATSTVGDSIPLSIDVTIAVQNLVRDSALTLPAATKSSLVGFCNPDPYTPESQQLKIVYWFRKRKHMAVFNDEDEVELPQREHLVKS